MYIFSIDIPCYGDLIYAEKIKKAGKGLVVPLLDALRRGEEQLEPPLALVQAFQAYHRVDPPWQALHVRHGCLPKKTIFSFGQNKRLQPAGKCLGR